ncbi:MAG TPA: type III polyketide synthase [Pirellulales bacterium]|nr:type III polyketide synthase [Pirellulales bacterium]
MDLTILGLGTAVPEHRMTQGEAVDLARQVCAPGGDQARALGILYRRAGVETRHTALPYQTVLDWLNAEDEGGVATCLRLGPTTQERMQVYAQHACSLAVRAASAALDAAQTPAATITHLVTVSCTGFAAPGVDFALIGQLGLNPSVERVQVGFMGCHGSINGLRVARALAASDPAALVLLCAVEICSIHYQLQWDPKKFVGNSIFADGAAAIVGLASSEADRSNWRVAATGSRLLPDSSDAMRWTIGDHGFEMELSPRVPELIRQHLRPWFEDWLKRQGLGIADIGSWAVHPGGPRILSAVEETLGLNRAALAVSRQVLADCGNMSSPTVLFILQRLLAQRAPRPCVMLGFGPGLMAEAALIV